MAKQNVGRLYKRAQLQVAAALVLAGVTDAERDTITVVEVLHRLETRWSCGRPLGVPPIDVHARLTMVPTGDEDVPATVRTGEMQDPVLDATGHGRC